MGNTISLLLIYSSGNCATQGNGCLDLSHYDCYHSKNGLRVELNSAR